MLGWCARLDSDKWIVVFIVVALLCAYFAIEIYVMQENIKEARHYRFKEPPPIVETAENVNSTLNQLDTGLRP